MRVSFLPVGIFFISLAVQAGIYLDSTRVIYPATKKEVTLGITSATSSPRLIQAWVENSAAGARAPFIVHPPIFRLDPAKGHTLRIMFLGGNIPQDRESVFWLSVLELQPKQNQQQDDNQIHFPVRSRIKLFYRPQGLPGTPKEAVGHLRWHLQDNNLICDNPTAFNVSFNKLELKGKDAENVSGMCPAKGQTILSLKDGAGTTDGKMALTTINDYGGLDENEANYRQ